MQKKKIILFWIFILAFVIFYSFSGMGQFVSRFAEPGDPEYAPPVQEAETPSQRRARIHKLRLEKGAEKAAEELQKYDPNNDPNISGDPYKTLFVARLNYETTESRIKREFESYGPIKRVGIFEYAQAGLVRGCSGVLPF
uniref:U1 small nuclear ribonucleoprotein 70 kDa n=1 Tax=Rhizophora mucronata TaxID=61149 RepID=A0A2P2L767_RHIMU